MRNETAQDLENEVATAALLEVLWSCKAEKLGKSNVYLADFALSRNGRIFSLAEIKCRTYPSTKFDTVVLSLNKFMWAAQFSETTGLPYLLVINFQADNVVKWLRLEPCIEREVRMFSCKTERETHPDEPVVHLEVSKFRTLPTRRV